MKEVDSHRMTLLALLVSLLALQSEGCALGAGRVSKARVNRPFWQPGFDQLDTNHNHFKTFRSITIVPLIVRAVKQIRVNRRDLFFYPYDPNDSTVGGNACSNSFGQFGVCLSLRKCWSKIGVVNLNIFNNNQCGWLAGERIVCCPNSIVTLGFLPFLPTKKPQHKVTPTPPQVSTESSTISPITTPDVLKPGSDEVFECGAAEPILAGTWPWTVRFSESDSNVLCQGTLLTRRHVVTVASCVELYRQTPEKLRVVVGRKTLENEVLSIDIHPDRELNSNFNVALMQLKNPISFDENALSICLPSSNTSSSSFQDKPALFAGFNQKAGDVNVNSVQVTAIVKKGNECNPTKSQTKNGGDETQFCLTSDNPRTDCQHIPGSIAMAVDNERRWIILGIRSEEFQCNKEVFQPVFNGIDLYQDWFQRVLDIS
ncbi:clotting factor B-like isoform X2 [Limulus polyphemus]|uniref:Clotting factor B-like isoform X2 n=1 Tax=Limulus polyphemus TaxID=6850 RepID=A0ABM1SAW3_LIMPO|nr:clotting factor B-like isoform X2 [Limulus polyphemus]